MKKQVLWLGMVILALAALPLAAGVGGSQARSFKAKSVAYITADYGPTYNVVKYGEATHLGKLEGEFLGIQYFPEGEDGPSNVGSGTLTAANGDSLAIDLVDYPFYMDEFIAVAHGTYTITGGTGRFLHASGQGTYIGVIDLSNLNPPAFSFEGTIVY